MHIKEVCGDDKMFKCSSVEDFPLLIVRRSKNRNQNNEIAKQIDLLYLSVSTRAVIGQFSGPYSTVRPAKI